VLWLLFKASGAFVNVTWLANHRGGSDLVARSRPWSLHELLQDLDLN
jgi:hypothetical protein